MSSNKAIVYSNSFHLPAASTKEKPDESVDVQSAGVLGLDQVGDACAGLCALNRPFDLNVTTARLHTCLVGELADF